MHEDFIALDCPRKIVYSNLIDNAGEKTLFPADFEVEKESLLRLKHELEVEGSQHCVVGGREDCQICCYLESTQLVDRA